MSAVTERALAAARAVAVAHGLAPRDATVVHSGSNVLVHLRPAPVVARVMTGTAALHDDRRAWLEREVAVLSFLAPHGVAVAPSPLIAPGPYEHDGLWLTFWTWLRHERQLTLPSDAAALGHALRELHDRLATFTGRLGDLTEIEAWLTQLTDDARLRRRLDELHEDVFASALPAQPLHGDASLGNLLRTPSGLVWNDFEDVCHGPVHWDVAGFLASLRHRGADDAFTARVLAAYGDLDAAALAPFTAADALYGEIWQRHDAARAR